MYWAYSTDEEERFRPECISNALRRIFEEKSVFEEGVYWAYSTDEKSDSHRNASPTLCVGFSRRNRYSKKECTGRTRLMRRAIYTENPSKDSAFAIAAAVTSAPLNILATSITLSLPLTRLMEVIALSPENSLVTT